MVARPAGGCRLATAGRRLAGAAGQRARAGPDPGWHRRGLPALSRSGGARRWPGGGPGAALPAARGRLSGRRAAFARPSAVAAGAATGQALYRHGPRHADPDRGVDDRRSDGGGLLSILSLDHVRDGVPLRPPLPVHLGALEPGRFRPGDRAHRVLATPAGALGGPLVRPPVVAGLRRIAADPADRCAGPGGGGQPGQEPLPRDHEPRAAHAPARDHRHGRSAPQHRPRERPARHGADRAQRRSDPARDDRRRLEHRPDRVRAGRSGVRFRSARRARDRARAAPPPGGREGPDLAPRDRPGGAAPAARRAPVAAADPGEPRRQRGQVHRPWPGHDPSGRGSDRA